VREVISGRKEDGVRDCKKKLFEKDSNLLYIHFFFVFLFQKTQNGKKRGEREVAVEEDKEHAVRLFRNGVQQKKRRGGGAGEEKKNDRMLFSF
jgi:hypothetical protein